MAGDFNRLEGTLVIPTAAGEIHLKRQCPPIVKARFEDWLELSARRRIARIRKQLGEKEYADAMLSVSSTSAAGKLAWGGEAFRLAIQDIAGIVELTVLLAHEAGQTDMNHETVMKAVVNKADSEVLMSALKEVMDSDANFLVPPPENMATTI